MTRVIRQRLSHHWKKPVVADSTQCSRGCIYRTRLAYLVTSFMVLELKMMNNSTVGHAGQFGNKINLAGSDGLEGLNFDNKLQQILSPPMWYTVQAVVWITTAGICLCARLICRCKFLRYSKKSSTFALGVYPGFRPTEQCLLLAETARRVASLHHPARGVMYL